MAPTQLDALNVSTGADEPFPQMFGRYMLLAPLGRGGMGTVYLAKHGGTAGVEKHCVVKTLRRDITADESSVARFLDEARVVVQLNHKGICNVFDFGKVTNRYYLAMDFVAGRELSVLWDRAREQNEAIPKNVVFYVLSEVLEALDYAHRLQNVARGEALGIVHRDVSPQNVMLSFEGEVKVIDFGLAVSTTKTQQTRANVVLGKLRYMSPEQAGGDPVDARTDLFAVAVMACELLTGEPFYGELNNQAVWAKAGLGGYRPAAFAAFDSALRDILERALATDPDFRYPTCGAFREALDGYAFESGIRGGARTLRELMLSYFDVELAQMRELLARHADAPLPAEPPPDPFRPFPNTPTTGLAEEPPAPRANSTDASSPQMTQVIRRAPSRHTTVHDDRSTWRRRILGLAALASAAIVVAAVFIARGASHVQPADAVPALATGSPAAAAAVVNTAEAPPPPAVVLTAHDPELASGPSTPSVEQAVEKLPAPTTQKPSAANARPTATKSKTKPPPQDAPIGAKFDWLKRTCPKLACTTQTASMKNETAKAPTPANIQALQNTVRQCVAACAR